MYLNSPTATVKNTTFLFTIQRGESLSTISTRLKRKDIIRSRYFLWIISKAYNTEEAFKVGKYRIPKDSSTMQIHSLLVSGREVLAKVTIPEGWTINKIAEELDTRGIVSGTEFMEVCRSEAFLTSMGIVGTSAEGYLFPDTYFFPEDYDPTKVAEYMIERMREVIYNIDPKAKHLTEQELQRKIILASIIEREYRIENEAPLIASVFYNRLEAGAGLSSCATIEYIITELQGKPHPEFLTYKDLEIESQYNTYKYAGLPPGAICNPGKTALKASFFPEDTNYWYFLLKNPETGEHHFSKDITEHIKARRLYLKGPS